MIKFENEKIQQKFNDVIMSMYANDVMCMISNCTEITIDDFTEIYELHIIELHSIKNQLIENNYKNIKFSDCDFNFENIDTIVNIDMISIYFDYLTKHYEMNNFEIIDYLLNYFDNYYYHDTIKNLFEKSKNMFNKFMYVFNKYNVNTNHEFISMLKFYEYSYYLFND